MLGRWTATLVAPNQSEARSRFGGFCSFDRSISGSSKTLGQSTFSYAVRSVRVLAGHGGRCGRGLVLLDEDQFPGMLPASHSLP